MLTVILIDVQYSHKAVFSFEKDSNHQNPSSSGSLHPVKKSPHQFPIPTPHWGIFPSTPYCYLEKPEHLHMLFSSEYQIMKHFS